jgi:DNA-binding transcriptional MocR family regulator
MDPFIRRSDGFLYEQIATDVSTMIEQGTLQPGDQVPSVRTLSRIQGVSISTVLHAYRLLEDRGLIEARPQSGFYVRAVERTPITEPSITSPPKYCCHVDMSDLVMRLMTTLSDPSVVPLGAALPAEELLPTERLGTHLARVARDPTYHALSYDPMGYPLLRRLFAQRGLLAGCTFDTADVIVTNGCMEALSLSLQAVTEPGDTVAIESPTYFGILLLLEKLGLRALELPTSPRTGICLDGTQEALARHDVAALLLTPHFANPTGSLMPDADKQALYDLLVAHDLPLIEDDIYGDLYFGDQRPQPIKALDTDGRVLYCTSVSKTIAPSYRVGFVSAGRYGSEVAALKAAHTASTALPIQRAVAAFIDRGGYEKHLRSLRRHYRDTLTLMREAVAAAFPDGTRITNPEGGFLLWVELPDELSATCLSDDAHAEGISIAPGALFAPSTTYRHCLRLNGAVVWSDRIEDAIATLGALAHDLQGDLEPVQPAA